MIKDIETYYLRLWYGVHHKHISEKSWERGWERGRDELLIWGSEPLRERLPYVTKPSSRDNVSSVEN